MGLQLGEIQRPHPVRGERGEYRQDAQDEARVADPVDHEGLASVVGELRVVVPERNQKVGAQAHALPTDEHQQQVVGQHQHQHREREQVHVSEVARVVLVMGHVADGVEMDHRADAADDERHHGGERVEAQGDFGMEPARGDPRPQRHFERRAGRHREQPRETP